MALEGDVVRPYASASYSYDSNMRRFSSSEQAQRSTGSSKLSDTMLYKEVGIILDKRISQQLLYVDAAFNRSSFNRNSELDSSGKEITAKWNWHLGREWEGNFQVYHKEAMVPFADFRVDTPGQLGLNLRTQERKTFDAAWRFHSNWRVRTAFHRYEVQYSAEAQKVANFDENSQELGLDYIASSGSRVGLVYRNAQGDRAQDRPAFFPGIGLVLINNDYKQQSLKADIDWLFSGKTRLEFLGGYVSRKHDSFSERDFSGFNARTNFNWAVTGKTSLKGSVWRDANALSVVTSSYVVHSGISAGVAWAATNKVTVSGKANVEKLEFQGDVTGQDFNRTDNNKSVSVGLIYRPTMSWNISTFLNRNLRDSSIENLNYQSTSLSLTGQYEF